MGALAVLFAIDNPNSRILCVRGTQNKISESSLQILKDVIYMLKYEDYFIITENTLKCKNGSDFLFYGAKNPSTFKSLQGIDFVFVDEATELSAKAWEFLIPTVRSDDSRFLVAFNPENESDHCYQEFIVNIHPDAEVLYLSFTDNPYFPEVLKKEMAYDKLRSISKYNHVWLGQLRKDVEGALWKETYFQYDDTDEFEKVAVAVDPAGSDSKTADEAGIVVAGKLGDKAWLLNDSSGRYSPLGQAKLAIRLYYKYDADYIVVEKNGVGAGFKTIIHQIDKSIPVKEVIASKGKKIRATPVASLYEDGRVYHTEVFAQLEHELTNYDEENSKISPGRLDATVYAITSLLLKKQHKEIKGMRRSSKRVIM